VASWFISQSEEEWNCADEFASMQEAIEAAPSVFGLSAGDEFFVGEGFRVAPGEAAPYLFDTDEIEDKLGEWAYDSYGCDESDMIVGATRPQMDDLEQRLRATFCDWLAAHAIESRYWHIPSPRSVSFDGSPPTRFDAEPVP
jgi:hypothetical protein